MTHLYGGTTTRCHISQMLLEDVDISLVYSNSTRRNCKGERMSNIIAFQIGVNEKILYKINAEIATWKHLGVEKTTTISLFSDLPLVSKRGMQPDFTWLCFWVIYSQSSFCNPISILPNLIWDSAYSKKDLKFLRRYIIAFKLGIINSSPLRIWYYGATYCP